MFRFNPSHSISHKAMIVMLYLQFFAVQWALKYTFSPETVTQGKISAAVVDKESAAVGDENAPGENSKLRLNKRYFPESSAIHFHSFDTTQGLFTEIEINYFFAASRYTCSVDGNVQQRGPPHQL